MQNVPGCLSPERDSGALHTPVYAEGVIFKVDEDIMMEQLVTDAFDMMLRILQARPWTTNPTCVVHQHTIGVVTQSHPYCSTQ